MLTYIFYHNIILKYNSNLYYISTGADIIRPPKDMRSIDTAN